MKFLLHLHLHLRFKLLEAIYGAVHLITANFVQAPNWPEVVFFLFGPDLSQIRIEIARIITRIVYTIIHLPFFTAMGRKKNHQTEAAARARLVRGTKTAPVPLTQPEHTIIDVDEDLRFSTQCVKYLPICSDAVVGKDIYKLGMSKE